MSTSKKRTASTFNKNNKNGASMKQGNLFSFFAKKPKIDNDDKNDSTTITATNINGTIMKSGNNTAPVGTKHNNEKANTNDTNQSPSSAAKNKDGHTPINKDWHKLKIGMRVSVYWPDDDKYYDAKITKQRKNDQAFHLVYDDDETEWLDLRPEKFRLIGNGKEQKQDDTAKKSPSPTPAKRRLAIEEDEDEEAEFDIDDASSESDGSVYVENKKNADESDHEDDDEDQWMVTDDEDDDVIAQSASKKNKGSKTKKLVKVTRHEEPEQTQQSTPEKGSRTTKNFLSQASLSAPTKTNSNSNFLRRVTPSSSVTSAKKQQEQSASTSHLQSYIATAVESPTVSSTSTKSPPFAASKTSDRVSIDSSKDSNNTNNNKAIPYVKGAVNPAGSHVHNHLEFLRNPRDKQGRATNDPEYDPRTLKVSVSDWERHGGTMTAAVKQWWDLKSQYFDTVLLFKTGKFYEMFHMDADVGVTVCGLSYMKGHTAHAGFPEVGYGNMANKLVLAGYKVARVEQTETPDMLKERKKKHKGKNSPKVVNREVCSILTMGTRTFCYLDKGLTEETDPSSHGMTSAGGGVGPLLVIREITFDKSEDTNMSDEDSDPDEVRPVCEYGITLVDAVRATVTLGQFADDILRSRMDTLLTTFVPSEILIEGGEQGASSTLQALIKSTLQNCTVRIEKVNPTESSPKSTALDPEIRRSMERKTDEIHPWDVDEALDELHRRGYYPRASRKNQDNSNTSRWPKILHAAIEGGANLALSSFGAALYYLQRNLIDQEILSMGIVKAYVPPASSTSLEKSQNPVAQLAAEQNREDDGLVSATPLFAGTKATSGSSEAMEVGGYESINLEQDINHLSLDGTTLHNLEILTNAVDHKVKGSLWSKINYTKTPHGSRLLRAWLLRPLFRKADIDRRADAVEELVSGGPAVALSEAVAVLSKCGDIERLLSRVHSMSGNANSAASSENDDGSNVHPNNRAMLYEMHIYTKRKVSDFSKVINGLRQASKIPELFAGIDINSGLLKKIVRYPDEGGCFPLMTEELDWFFKNFDADKAAQGLFGPSRGMDDQYDEACDMIDRIQKELNDFKEDMCNDVLKPRGLAKSSWKYINTKHDSKDKYLIELPASIAVPDDFIMKGKRGNGAKQVNKYRAAEVEQLVYELEKAIALQKERKARGMELIFAKFDSKRALWEAAAHATAVLDALGSLAQTATKPNYCRPKILECPLDVNPCVRVTQGRHPCVDTTPNSGDFVPNDLSLGMPTEENKQSSSRVLLLSGPNMGGKSTLLRQTCLITIMAQIGCYVPAAECEITPVDRIFTRLGASDRILLGQSTFFVELAETAAALRGATRRSLVIMDELGRGTSTFDGTAIAHATVQHLVQRSKCLSLFATHYHSLLDDWEDNPNVRLGHMQCNVDEVHYDGESEPEGQESGDNTRDQGNITFLYTLGDGVCPKSFGINVARLASLPEDVLVRAKRISSEFEQRMNENKTVLEKNLIIEKIRSNDWESIEKIWSALQQA